MELADSDYYGVYIDDWCYGNSKSFEEMAALAKRLSGSVVRLMTEPSRIKEVKPALTYQNVMDNIQNWSYLADRVSLT